MTGFTKDVAGMIVVRDQGKCARCGAHVAHLERGWAWAIHHRRPRSFGGTRLAWVNQAANGVVLCRGCHEWVESHREVAIAAGFLVSANGVLVAADVAIRHVVLGFVYLDDQGGWCPVEEGPTPESIWGEAA